MGRDHASPRRDPGTAPHRAAERAGVERGVVSASHGGVDLLEVLEQRPNLGFSEAFGQPGAIVRRTTVALGNRRGSRFTLRLDHCSDPIVVEMEDGQLGRRGLLLHPRALSAEARVFVLDTTTPRADEVFFLQSRREVVHLLRLNLLYLQRRNDETSRALFQRMAGRDPSELLQDRGLCMELFRFRKKATKHVARMLETAGKRQRSALQGLLDEGERQDYLARIQEGIFGDADRLSDKEMKFLVNTVRARYFGRLMGFMAAGKGKLSPLGEKLYRGRGVIGFTREERRTILSLAIRPGEDTINEAKAKAGAGARTETDLPASFLHAPTDSRPPEKPIR